MKAVYKKTVVETFQEIIQPYIDGTYTKDLEYIEVSESEYKILNMHYNFEKYIIETMGNDRYYMVYFPIGKCSRMAVKLKIV